MKEVADGRYGAEIPTSATSGGTVAYYIEAEDAERRRRSPRAARSTIRWSSTCWASASAIARTTTMTTTTTTTATTKGRTTGYFVGLMAGWGFGWATGTGDTNADVTINPVGPAPAGLVQVAPEFGYWLDSALMLSLQIRYQYITGTTDIHERRRQCPNGVCQTANYALAAFAKATWKFGGSDSKFHPFFSLAAGGGPHPPRRQLQATDR